jgi:hypothetical protein
MRDNKDITIKGKKLSDIKKMLEAKKQKLNDKKVVKK